MARWSIVVDGVEVVPYFQQYACWTDPDMRRGELLSRPVGVDRVEEFFEGLPYEEHLRVLEWQMEVKEEFSASTNWRVSINVHNVLVASLEQQERFVALLRGFPTPVTLEFTETHPMPPVIESNRLLRSLRELGHLTALDDFGAGLNGMSLLTDYDFDVVKLDRSLVYDIDARPAKRKTVALIGQMLGVLGKEHVVEGVASSGIQEVLVGCGFQTFQGFAIQRPEPMELMAARLSTEEVVA